LPKVAGNGRDGKARKPPKSSDLRSGKRPRRGCIKKPWRKRATQGAVPQADRVAGTKSHAAAIWVETRGKCTISEVDQFAGQLAMQHGNGTSSS
jgi:hypothetical protein